MNLLDVVGVKKVYYVSKDEGNFGERIANFFGKNKIPITAVDGIELHIKPGEMVGFIGQNGAGKSTTIKMMTGVLQPDEGSIALEGINPNRNRKKYLKKIGCVFGQRSQLWWDLPVKESFRLLKEIYGVSDSEYGKTMEEFKQLIQLEELLSRPVRQLSLGQRMRCEIIAAFLHKPKMVFLDEPTIGLDILAKDDIRKIIRYLNHEYGTTIIIASHDMSDIEELCKRIIIIDKGKILYDGTLEEILQLEGNYKTVKVTLNREVDIQIPGVKVLSDEGKVKVLMVDHNLVTVSDLIKGLSELAELMDVEVRGTKIENLVKEIYQSGSLCQGYAP